MAVITVTAGSKLRRVDPEVEYEDAVENASDEEMEDADEGAGTAAEGALVTPGELVTEDTMWMRGHGTYARDEQTISSVAGTITRVNKLLTVKPLRGRYVPVVGDHVVGRITEVGNRRWRVDIGASQDAVLLLGSVNLPGGVLRRKSESDELQMRAFLKEGDLLNAEVQGVFGDGSVSLHTRSLRYGKLRNGMFFRVPSALVVRLRTQTYRLPGGVDMILGVNGYIWLNKSSREAPNDVSITRLEEESSLEIYRDTNDEIPAGVRENIARYANCLRALAFAEVGINETRLIAAYEASLAYADVGELVERDVMLSLAQDVVALEQQQ